MKYFRFFIAVLFFGFAMITFSRASASSTQGWEDYDYDNAIVSSGGAKLFNESNYLSFENLVIGDNTFVFPSDITFNITTSAKLYVAPQLSYYCDSLTFLDANDNVVAVVGSDTYYTTFTYRKIKVVRSGELLSNVSFRISLRNYVAPTPTPHPYNKLVNSTSTIASNTGFTGVAGLVLQPLPMLCICMGLIGFGLGLVRRIVGCVKH